ncbi:hypothetical protein Mapa_011622 [Marchantia paleacea]|nr:hypothetical protein Mapa_011622 [Marchantia paleacea]
MPSGCGPALRAKKKSLTRSTPNSETTKPQNPITNPTRPAGRDTQSSIAHDNPPVPELRSVTEGEELRHGPRSKPQSPGFPMNPVAVSVCSCVEVGIGPVRLLQLTFK